VSASTPVVIALTVGAVAAILLLAWLIWRLRRAIAGVSHGPDRAVEDDALRAAPSGARLQSIRGIGPATEERLRGQGIQSVEDLANLDFEAFEQLRTAIGRRPEQVSWLSEARRLSGTEQPPPEIG
jgi:predicted flap endonuclease-1-like 5' DNA nuclease